MIIFDFPHFLIEIFGKGRAVSDFAATVLDTEEEWSGFCLEKQKSTVSLIFLEIEVTYLQLSLGPSKSCDLFLNIV